MDGYDIVKIKDGYKEGYFIPQWKVYTITRENNRTIKHYHNGYDNYKQMILNHPELKA